MAEALEQVSTRCVCGRSSKLPFCDGSHRSAKWSCEGEDSKVELLVAASPILYTYAERLAYALGGRAAHQSAQLSSKRLIRLLDVYVTRPAPHLRAERVLNVSIGVPLHVMERLLPVHEALVYVEDAEPPKLWRTLKSKCQDEQSWLSRVNQSTSMKSPRLFLSHAILDEPMLMTVISKLRDQFGLHIFVCADSLEAGGRWRDDIQSALDDSDLMLITFSEHLRNSTFCAYEIGYAHGRGLKTIAISLDGTVPPQYLSHLQCIELPRRQAIMPWYSTQELLLILIIELLSQNHQTEI